MKTFEGKLVSKGIKVGIVAARFNEFITAKLLGGAMDALLRHDVEEKNIHVAWVPGAFEIPLIASRMAKSGKYDVIICLGAVIRGSTSHYDYVCSEVAKGIATVSLESGIPCLLYTSILRNPFYKGAHLVFRTHQKGIRSNTYDIIPRDQWEVIERCV